MEFTLTSSYQWYDEKGYLNIFSPESGNVSVYQPIMMDGGNFSLEYKFFYHLRESDIPENAVYFGQEESTSYYKDQSEYQDLSLQEMVFQDPSLMVSQDPSLMVSQDPSLMVSQDPSLMVSQQKESEKKYCLSYPVIKNAILTEEEMSYYISQLQEKIIQQQIQTQLAQQLQQRSQQVEEQVKINHYLQNEVIRYQNMISGAQQLTGMNQKIIYSLNEKKRSKKKKNNKYV